MRTCLVTIALFPVLLAGSQQHKRVRGSASREAPPQLQAEEIAKIVSPDLSEGATGNAVIRAQILLARAHFSCGQIDSRFGSNLRKAIAAFQQERQLPPTGALDAQTWNALNADTAPVITAYTISDEDEAGPFVAVPKNLMEAAKLKRLGYASPLDELGERFHVSPDVLRQLNSEADFSRPGQTLQVPNAMVMPPTGPAAQVVVSKGEASVRAYDAQGHLSAFYVATIGSEHDPLPLGQWKVNGTKRDPTFQYDASLFWDAKSPGERAQIPAGPRNPVGSVWIDLSKDHYGIHGTPDASLVGHATSHGCIRLTNWDALDLASQVRPGTPVLLKE